MSSAILSLSETQDYQHNPEWIAERLGINRPEARSALDRLERLGILIQTPDGKIKCKGLQYMTSDEVANESVRRSHLEDLELARFSLEVDVVSERDFTAMTIAIDRDKLPVAKRMIREFRDKFCAFMESGSKKDVYKFGVHLFPLTCKKGQKR